MNKTSDTTNAEERLEFDALNERLDRLEEASKESEVSLLRSFRTLFDDYHAYHTGARETFPKSALVGVMFAYLRPRIIVTFAGIAAAIFACLQAWILWNQNTLLDQQNRLLNEQRQSNMIEALAAVVSSVDDEESEAVAVALLVAAGDQGFQSLLELVRSRTELGVVASEALIMNAATHSEDQVNSVLTFFTFAANSELNRLFNALSDMRIDEGAADGPFVNPATAPQRVVASVRSSNEKFVLISRYTEAVFNSSSSDERRLTMPSNHASTITYMRFIEDTLQILPEPVSVQLQEENNFRFLAGMVSSFHSYYCAEPEINHQTQVNWLSNELFSDIDGSLQEYCTDIEIAD